MPCGTSGHVTDTPGKGHRTITIRPTKMALSREAVTVVLVTIDVDQDLVLYTDSRPYRCTRGHWLLPGHMIVASRPCSCGRGRHTTWECECGDITYSPKLRDSCALSTGC